MIMVGTNPKMGALWGVLAPPPSQGHKWRAPHFYAPSMPFKSGIWAALWGRG